MVRTLLILVALGVAAFGNPFGQTTTGPGWIYTRLGKRQDVQTTTRPGIMFDRCRLTVRWRLSWTG